MRSSRSLAIATAVVFGISTIFSVVASLLRDASSLPIIVGEMDGVLAFVLVVMAMVLWSALSVEHRSCRNRMASLALVLHPARLVCSAGSAGLSVELDVPAAGAPKCRKWQLLLRAKLDASKKTLALCVTM